MGFRFRKSIKLGGARINISKSGVGGSIGVNGARITRTANGRTRRTFSIPGTGLSHVSESGSSRRKGKSANVSMWMKIAAVLFSILGVLMIALGALLTLALPAIGLISIAIGIIELYASKCFKKNIKKSEGAE